MSTIETILSRAMSDPEFAELLFTDAQKALAGYDLSEEAIENIKKISRAKFDEMTTEERKSMIGSVQTGLSMGQPVKDW